MRAQNPRPRRGRGQGEGGVVVLAVCLLLCLAAPARADYQDARDILEGGVDAEELRRVLVRGRVHLQAHGGGLGRASSGLARLKITPAPSHR